MSFTVDINCAEIKRELGSDDVGQFLANRAVEYMDPFVPYRDGHLAKSAVASPFLVEYMQPYAHRVWEAQGITIHTDGGHPMATKHWEETAERMHRDELAEDLYNYLGRRG